MSRYNFLNLIHIEYITRDQTLFFFIYNMRENTEGNHHYISFNSDHQHLFKYELISMIRCARYDAD